MTIFNGVEEGLKNKKTYFADFASVQTLKEIVNFNLVNKSI